jgi:DNA polymerase-3 subunit alpha
VTAIYRPGPLKANVNKKYVAAEFDLPSIVYKHPMIREVLEPTRGFCVFQETFMEMSQKLSGFTDGEAAATLDFDCFGASN